METTVHVPDKEISEKGINQKVSGKAPTYDKWKGE